MENRSAPMSLIFFNISPFNSLNLVLIPGAKSDGHQGTWTGCQNACQGIQFLFTGVFPGNQMNISETGNGTKKSTYEIWSTIYEFFKNKSF